MTVDSQIIADRLVGDVFLREFDLGVFNTLECFDQNGHVFISSSKIPGVKVPRFDEHHNVKEEIGKPMPGIPVIFVNPDDSMQHYNIPCIRITREDISPALERWMSLHLKSRGPAPGAREITVRYGGRILHGYDKYEEQDGSWPFDISYTVTCESSGLAARTESNLLIRYVMKKFPPYGVLKVIDSNGDERKYNVFVEGPSELGIIADIRDRGMIMALSVRVEAELDLSDPRVVTVVTEPIVRTAKM